MIPRWPSNRSQCSILLALHDLGGEGQCRAISKVSGVEYNTVKRAIDRLVAFGYVEKREKYFHAPRKLTDLGWAAVPLILEARGTAASA